MRGAHRPRTAAGTGRAAVAWRTGCPDIDRDGRAPPSPPRRIGSGRMRGSGSKPGIVSRGIAATEHALDVVEQLQLVDADERHGVAVDAGAARPADAVDVVLGDHRQLEVDDVRERLDVEAAGRDLGGDQDGEPAGLEVGQGADALRLALVAVDRGGRRCRRCSSCCGEPVRAVLGPGEDERLVDPAGRDEVAEQLALALAVDHVDDLGHELGRRCCAA